MSFALQRVFLALCLAIAGCAQPVSEVLPISSAIVGNSRIAEVDVVVRPEATAAVAALDERARARDPSDDELTRLPVAELLERRILEAAARYGLTTGRALRIVAEIDAIAVPGTAGAMFGRADLLSGTAFIRDQATGEPLGQLYIEVRRGNGGLIATVIRGGGVRERLAAQYGDHIARALSGRRGQTR